MESQDNSIFFYCNKNRYILSLIVCLLCAGFSVYVIFKMQEFKWLAFVALAFFVYKSGVYAYEAFFNKKPLVELKENEIIFDGCPPLPFKDIEVVGQKRVNVGSSSMLYVCLKTDENKFKLSDVQKDNLSLGLTAFCFRPAAMKRKDADFLIKEILSKVKQK